MTLLRLSSQKTALLAGMLAVAAGATPPGAPLQGGFTAVDAVKAEWDRTAPVLAPGALEALPPADRARLELTLKRIGAPGAPALLPPWLENPTVEVWEAKAREARSPQERFTALFFLNRLKSPGALIALEGLRPEDVPAWPRHLHLESQVATARLNGGEVSPQLQAFLEALRPAGKVDPVREKAARLRLVLAGKEQGQPRMPDASVLAYLDAWNRGPWEARAADHPRLLAGALASPFVPGPAQRLMEGLPPRPIPETPALAAKGLASTFILVRMATLEYLQRLPALEEGILAQVKTAAFRTFAGPACAGYLAVLRKHAPADADRYDAMLMGQDDVLAMGTALEDMPRPPADLEGLIQRLWKTSQYEAVQTFLPALERWKLPQEKRKAILTRFLGHPCWTARLDAFNLLVKVDPATAWPQAPTDLSAVETGIRESALRLAAAAKPVRLRITFEGAGSVVLRLDPVNAPINVANMVSLARRGFFNGHALPRVVPDFLLQMGSPCDTMDGDAGYTVRCEDSLDWFGPGSVGMALSGKDTGGCQFTILTNAAPHLTGRYTRMGEVEDPDYALPLLDSLDLGTRILKVEVI